MQKGYSLIELLAVMVIVGLMGSTAAHYLGSPNKASVVGALSEMEGVIGFALKRSQTDLGRVNLVSSGRWSDESIFLGFRTVSGDEKMFNIKAIKNYRDMIIDTSPDQAALNTATAGDPLSSFLTSNFPTGYSSAMGNPLFTGSFNESIFVDPQNRMFSAGFVISVIAARNGEVYSGAPAGVLLVMGSTSFKFYKPGPGEPWRRV